MDLTNDPSNLVQRTFSKSYYLTYTLDGSNKYWGALEDGGNYVVLWGAIGRPAQSQRVTGGIFHQRLNEKKSKGYQSATHEAPYMQWLSDPKKYFKRLSLTPQLFGAIEQLHLEQQVPKPSGSPKTKNPPKRL